MNFDGDNLNKDLPKTECKIQKEIFKHALNKTKKQALKRYSDKYTQALPTNKEKIKNLVYHEILPKELQDALLKHKINIERTENIEEEVSSESEGVESNEDENDYNKNYYDEDEEEFVDEDVKGEDDYE